ncbi:hypothetical protein L3Q82_020631, partial [Scortum barcoo]
MAHSAEDAPLARGSLAGSEEALVLPAGPRGSSNSRAFKIAGLTTLACLLLASQVFTAYMVFNQKQQIHTLQKNTERMGKQLSRPAKGKRRHSSRNDQREKGKGPSSQLMSNSLCQTGGRERRNVEAEGGTVAPMRMHMPMNSLPLLMDFTADVDAKTPKTPMTKLQDTAVVSVEKQLKELMQDAQLPQFNETFMANLQSLKQQINESDWKTFETWMRYWLIFQMAQEKPVPPTANPASLIKTKCQVEASGFSKIGAYLPQCDEQGNYKPMQCWHATGYCWCVDEDGKTIDGTTMRGRPDCQRGLFPRRMALAPSLMQRTISVDGSLTSQIKALQLEESTVDASFLQPSFQALHHQLLGSLKSLGLVCVGLVKIDYYWAQRLKSLSHLDLSENPISYAGLQNISHCPSLSFRSLISFHLRNSSLTSLQSLCAPLTLAPALATLDVSRNSFSVFHYPRSLQAKWLRMLNLSRSGITDVGSSLSASLEELDLSYNSLEVFSNPPQALKKLYLSNNHLIRLPSLGNLSHLQELKVDGNQLAFLINESGVSLRTLMQLDVLRAGRNPYQCDCGLRKTIAFLDNADGVSVEDFPEEFLCATPAARHGNQIMNSSLEIC